MAVPDWMTADFFQSCLQSDELQLVTVTNHTIQPASIPEGSNYGSHLFNVEVNYKREDTQASISLIVKVPVAQIEELFGEIYEKEKRFYNEFIKETYKLSKHEMVPKHFNSPNPSCVVLENLSSSGYIMPDRHNLLDLEQCQLFIKAKAKLHALSVAIHKKNPEIVESLGKQSESFKENDERMTKAMLIGGLRCVAAFLEDKHETKEYLNIIKKASKNDNIWKMFLEVEKSNSNKPLKALVQLDPWCTNMMFNYDSLGKVKSIKLLDFQTLSFTTPLKEIVTFMSMCPNLEVRKTKLNYLYHLYCDSFNESLAELNCSERLIFEEMKTEIVAMSPLVLMMISSGLPWSLGDGVADIDEILSGNILNRPVRESSLYTRYRSAGFNKFFPQILDEIAKTGVFNYIEGKLKQMESQQ